MSSAHKLFCHFWIFLLVVSSAFAAPTDPVDAGALARAIAERRSKVAESNPLPTGLTEHTLNRCIEILKRKGS